MARSSSVHTIGFTAMASRCEIGLDGLAAPQAAAAAERAIEEVRRIEAKYSRYRDDSLLAAINRAAGSSQAVETDAETDALLDFGARLHALSGGRFDLTSGVLRRAWDFKAARLPQPAQLEALLPLVDWTAVWREPGRVRLTRAGMELDFGGIGKEYAADRAATALAEAGVRHGYVNLGGDLRVVGPQADGSPWRLGVQHPRHEHTILAGVSLGDGGLATSGDYERYFEADGRRYCHILDARTGWPVTHWQSVSVVAPACVAAGALATVAMLLGAPAIDMLRAQGVGYLVVDALGGLHHSSVDDDTFDTGLPTSGYSMETL